MSELLDEAFLRSVKSKVKQPATDIEVEICLVVNESEDDFVQRNIQELYQSGRGNFTRDKSVKTKSGLRQFVCDHYGRPGTTIKKGTRKGMVRSGCNAYVSFVFVEQESRKACIRRLKTTHIGHNPMDDIQISGETIAAPQEVHAQDVTTSIINIEPLDQKEVIASSTSIVEGGEQIVWTEGATSITPTGSTIQMIVTENNEQEAPQIVYISTASEVGPGQDEYLDASNMSAAFGSSGEPVVLMVDPHGCDHNYSGASSGSAKTIIIDPIKLGKCYTKGTDGKMRIDYNILEQIEELEKKRNMELWDSQVSPPRKRTRKEIVSSPKRTKIEQDDENLSETEEHFQKSNKMDRLKDLPPLPQPVTPESIFWHNFPLLNFSRGNQPAEKNAITVGEIERRISKPECLCLQNVLKYLRVAKSAKQDVHERLSQCGLQCHTGFSQLVSSFTKITEVEAESLSQDYSSLAAQFLPLVKIAEQHLNTTTMHIKMGQIAAALHLLDELTVLVKDHSSSFSSATHTAGPSLLDASFNVFKEILHQELKLLSSST